MIKYTITEYKQYNKEEIMPLYESVGWTNYTKNPEMLAKAYKSSLYTLAAYDNEKLIGIIRTVGDGFSIVFIQDILIHPEYQRNGIGTELVKCIKEHFSSVYQMELMTDNTPKTISFYKSLGFTKADEMGACAFVKM
ncbi:MAG: GNAT family N-acetyltransferase [Oscillospiraceae bacterium]